MIHMEVDQEPYIPSAQPYVREKLRLMNGIDCFYAFDFDDDDVLDDQVNSISQIDPLAVINHWESRLLGNRKALLPKLVSKAGFIGAFEQAWPK